jgi:hypothetical protein
MAETRNGREIRLVRRSDSYWRVTLAILSQWEVGAGLAPVEDPWLGCHV